MKLFFCLLLTSVLSSNLAQCQIVNIPDSIFKAKIIEMGLDVNSDGEISYDEVVNVDSLDLIPVVFQMAHGLYRYIDTISDMTGLDAFIGLEVLKCSGNPITSLDLSKNILLEKLVCNDTNIELLNLDNNIRLKELTLVFNYELLSIDISKLTELQFLDISGAVFSTIQFDGHDQLKTFYCRHFASSGIDISPLINLEYFNCEFSDLLHLDFSHNPKLKTVISSLTLLETIILNGNDSLTVLAVSYSKLKTLDVRGAPNLVELSCAKNDLHELIVSDLTNLKMLDCQKNNLSILNVKNNSSLHQITCGENNIGSLEFKNNDSLKYLYCDDNKLTTLLLDEIPSINSIECRKNLFVDLSINSASLRTLYCSDNPKLTRLDISEVKNIKNLNLSNMPQEIEVCVWTLPFPTTDPYINYGANNSPNITFKICTDAISEVPKDFIKIFPNPATDILNIEWDNYWSQNIEISLINAIGQTVYLSTNPVGAKISLSVNGLDEGVYFVKIQSSEHTFIKKIILINS